MIAVCPPEDKVYSRCISGSDSDSDETVQGCMEYSSIYINQKIKPESLFYPVVFEIIMKDVDGTMGQAQLPRNFSTL